ncbi:GDSL-type esterase/lipase family protein [Streptococcus pacificus]|uniref:Esterase n=1 Tax=Streptococcus pacificus TaxID=2740577 RepID=A0ABS0ZIE5_9STRE|nr:GDSL-type esterase/lipase family protein [Streptococcus pacificus]MBJ8325770.1 esterase [Streptococcus pacificus]
MGKNKKILLIGDSLFARHEGFNKPAIEAFLLKKSPQLIIYNSSVAGDATIDVLNRMAAILSIEPCDMVFILIGTNDLALNKQVPLREFQDNLLKIISFLKEKYTSKQIVFLSPSPVDEQKQRYRHNRLIETYIEAIVTISKKEQCRFINLYQLFLEAAKQTSISQLLEGSLDDGLHFGSAGYSLLADVILEQL